MLKRIITGALLSLTFFGLIFYLPLFYLAIVFSGLSLYGFYEWLKVSQQSIQSIIFNLLIMIGIMMILLFYHNHSTVIILAYTSFFAWLMILFDMYFGSIVIKKIFYRYSSIVGLYVIISAWFLLISLGSTSSVFTIDENKYLLFSMAHSNIHIYILALVLLISLTDSSGYFIGKFFGKTKLCENISPNKTIIGLAGSIMIPVTFFIVLYLNILNKPIMITDILFMLICCIYCTVGDLFMSTFKRFYNVKDTGKILPGHGGLLDRLDSYLPTIPIFQIWLFL